MLNDFINVSINNLENTINQDYYNYDKNKKNYKFSKIALEKIFYYCIKPGKLELNKMLKQIFGFDIKKLEGYRINKSGKPEFSTMSIYRSVVNIANSYNYKFEWIENVNIYNKVIYYMTIVPSYLDLINIIENDIDI